MAVGAAAFSSFFPASPAFFPAFLKPVFIILSHIRQILTKTIGGPGNSQEGLGTKRLQTGEWRKKGGEKKGICVAVSFWQTI